MAPGKRKSANDMKQAIKDIFEASIEAKKKFFLDEKNIALLEEAARAIMDCYDSGGKVLIFGNGGSAADSQHMAAELMARFEKERKSLPCVALSTNTSILTALSNDYDFTITFSRQIEGLAAEGDVAIAISTSGNSANVIKGAEKARKAKMKVIALAGRDGGKLAALADIPIVVDSPNTARIQEVHEVIIHALCKVVEDSV